MTFNDIFKSSFLEKVSSFSLVDALIALAMAFAIGLFIMEETSAQRGQNRIAISAVWQIFVPKKEYNRGYVCFVLFREIGK